MPLRVLIVDDEAAARENLRRLLHEVGGVAVVGECGDGAAAVERLRDATDVDLVLLDVQMPELDGFAVIAEVGVDRMPPVVFTTAYDAHALHAFDVHAVGYLLKPVSAQKLAATVERVRAGRTRAAMPATSAATPLLDAESLARLVDALRGPAAVTRLAVKRDGRTTFVDVTAVDWIEAHDVYARLHVAGHRYDLRQSLAELERLLPPHDFVRVHRGAIVRVDRIREIQPWFRGDHVLILADGTRVTSGRTYRDVVQRLLTHR